MFNNAPFQHGGQNAPSGDRDLSRLCHDFESEIGVRAQPMKDVTIMTLC